MLTDQWWQCGDDAHVSLHGTVEAIESQQASRITRLTELRALYGERPRAAEALGVDYLVLDQGENAPAIPLPVNVVAEVVDAWVATVVRARPRPVEVSINGDYTQREKAKDRTRFHDGVAYQTRLRRHMRKLGLDWAVVGAGALKGYHEHGQLRHWAVPIEEIWVDEMDAEDGEPSCIYHRHYVDRHALRELYPSSEQAIWDASVGTKTGERWFGYNTKSDQVLVTEGWHLKSGPSAGDGRHVIAVDTGMLLDEKWLWDRFPFAFLKNDPMLGFWPRSLADRLVGAQAAINSVLEQILANARQYGVLPVLVPRGSRISPSSFNDSLEVTLIEYTGDRPSQFSAMVVPPELFRLVEMFRQGAYQAAGLPETMAGGAVQPGLESLPAIRAASDVKLARHALDGEVFEEFRLDIADLDLHVARDLAKSGKVETIFVGRRYGREEAKRIAYWEPEEGEEYALRCYPSSQLSEHLSARIQQVAELEASGAIGPEEKLDLLDVPDTQGATDSRTAGLRRIEQQIDMILSDSTYTPPQPYLPLQLALVRANAAYNLAQADDVEESKLSMLRKWIDKVQQLMSEAAPPPPPPPAPMPGPEMAGPMPGAEMPPAGGMPQ